MFLELFFFRRFFRDSPFLSKFLRDSPLVRAFFRDCPRCNTLEPPVAAPAPTLDEDLMSMEGKESPPPSCAVVSKDFSLLRKPFRTSPSLLNPTAFSFGGEEGSVEEERPVSLRPEEELVFFFFFSFLLMPPSSFFAAISALRLPTPLSLILAAPPTAEGAMASD